MSRRPSTASPTLENDIRKLFAYQNLSIRYPSPDPRDPFAPLSVLRSRQAGSFSQLSLVDGESDDSTLPATSPTGPTNDAKPTRGWRRFQHRRSDGPKLAQTPDPEPPIWRHHSMPPRRHLQLITQQPAFLLGAADGGSPTANEPGDLRLHLSLDSNAFMAAELGRLEADPECWGGGCDDGFCSRASSRNAGYQCDSPDDTPPTPDESKSFVVLSRLPRDKKSFATLTPPATPSTVSSSPKIPPASLEAELSSRHILRPTPKPHRPSYSMVTTNSVMTFTTNEHIYPPRPHILSSSQRPDVSCHPSLADIKRFPFDTSLASLQPQNPPRRRNSKLQKVPRRPRTSQGGGFWRRQTSKSLPQLGRNGSRSSCQPCVYPPPAQESLFSQTAIPTQAQLTAAASLTVVAENGARVKFGDLWAKQRTVVCFIRHFWCPFCQDYMASITENATLAALKDSNLKLIVIGNGSHALIKGYRQIFQTPFPVYTDPTLRLYNALGMTLKTFNPGAEAKRGKYIKHGLLGGIAKVVLNAVKVGMPVWEKGGEFSQLGGEFVLGPGIKCTYAHRMRTTRGHASIAEVLAAGGADVTARIQRDSVTVAQRSIYTMTQDEETQWLESRRRSWKRLQSMKTLRRFGESVPRSPVPCEDGDGNALPDDEPTISEEDEGDVRQASSSQASKRLVQTLPPKEKIWGAAFDRYP